MSKPHEDQPTNANPSEAVQPAKITLLDLGDKQYGDCVLCQFGTETVLIDGSHNGDEAHILKQLKWLLRQSGPYVRVSLIIVTHPHDDHVGCLPRLVANRQLQAEWALVADPQFRWGPMQEFESVYAGRHSREQALTEALFEEDRSAWPDAELARFIENVGSLSSRYRTMLDQLQENGTTVVLSGSDQIAALQNRFANIGLELIGPGKEHLTACYELLSSGRSESLELVEESFTHDESMDVVTAYRNALMGFEERIRPNKGAINLQSLVTRFAYDGRRFLFAGDMQFSEPEVESEFLVANVREMRNEIRGGAPYAFVKLSHHASYNGFNDEVLEELGETALFGICGGHYSDNNSHPHRNVLRLLDQNRQRLRWVRTDHNRQVTITFGPGDPQIRLTSGEINDASLNHEEFERIEAESIVEAESFKPSAPAISAAASELVAKIPANATRLRIEVELTPAFAPNSGPQAEGVLEENVQRAESAFAELEAVTPSRQVLAQQLARARNNGWIPFFNEAAQRFNFTVPLLLGIASRETNIRNIVGDGGHGHGIMQIDDRSFPDFTNSSRALDPRQNILKGGEVLNGKRLFLSRNGVSGDLLSRGSIAAYNGGEGRVLRAIRRGRSVDSVTTQGDYSADVLARTAIFRELLG